MGASCVACTIPNRGPMYDSLITIDGPDKQKLITVSVPQYLTDDPKRNYPAVLTLAYSRPSESSLKMAEASKELEVEIINGYATAKFFAEPKAGLKPYIRVAWLKQGGLCSGYGVSNFLD